MTELLDADWLRGVQLFPKINKMSESFLNTKEIAPQERKEKH